jgi:6-phosphogluconolactonase
MASESDFDGYSTFDSELDLTIYADQEELVAEVTAQALQIIEDRLLAHGIFHIMLTGGTLGSKISEALLAAWNHAPDLYAGLNIWWSDERFVASDSLERNAFPLHGKMLNSQIAVHEIPAANSGLSIEQANASYSKSLSGIVIDLNILGLGPDGHVASIFPGIANLDAREDFFVITDSPKPPAERISSTMTFLNRSREVWIVASGAEKADAVAKVVEGDISIPASYLSAAERTRLVVDQSAFLAD